jgi:hypothetical protein
MPSAIVGAASTRTRSPASSARHGGQSGGLNADDLHVGPGALDRQRDAADEAAAPDGNDERLDLRHLLEDLEPERGLARHHARIVERVDEDEPALGLERARALVGLVVVRAVEDHFGAIAAGVGDLDERRVLGHDDGGGNSEPRGVEGDGQTMVPRAGRDDSPPPLLGAELQQQVGGAALLEGAGHLQVLQLHETARAGELRQRLRVRAGRLDDGVAQPTPGGLDGGDVDRVHQKGTTGSLVEGDIHATGMKGVECA